MNPPNPRKHVDQVAQMLNTPKCAVCFAPPPARHTKMNDPSTMLVRFSIRGNADAAKSGCLSHLRKRYVTRAKLELITPAKQTASRTVLLRRHIAREPVALRQCAVARQLEHRIGPSVCGRAVIGAVNPGTVQQSLICTRNPTVPPACRNPPTPACANRAAARVLLPAS